MGFYTGHTEAASNRADWIFDVVIFNEKINDFVDYTGATITVALRPTTQSAPAFNVTNHDGHITVMPDPGKFEVRFTRAEMATFAAGELEIGITVLFADGITYQILAGQVEVVDGIVTA